jgi:hypothetical protein
MFASRRIPAAVVSALLALVIGCSKSASASASASSTNGQPWPNNGAIACEKYLTPDFVGQIFKNPTGHARKLGAQGCTFETPDFASIKIALFAAGPSVFDARQKYLSDPVPLTGVGDKAVRTASGIKAIKGRNRMCDIVVTPPFGNKLSGEALAKKLGEICNKLFALPE